jgi:hypothetical protein
MSTEETVLTVVQLTVMKIMHLTALQAPNIGLTGMVTWLSQIVVKMKGRQTINPILTK